MNMFHKDPAFDLSVKQAINEQIKEDAKQAMDNSFGPDPETEAFGQNQE